MKRYIFPLMAFALVMASCEDDKAEKPTAAISIDKTTLEINESMMVRFHGSADNVVVYTGDTDHDYELRDQSNTGLVVNKGVISYSYSTPGTYKVVCVAVNHEDAGKSVETDTCSMYVKVIDDNTEINSISAPQVLYDEVFARRLTDSDWMMAIPRKIRFRGKDAKIQMHQLLKFYIPSLTTEIMVNGEAFNARTRYKLDQVQQITAKSHQGTTRDYKLYTVNYGEFETFKLAGVEGKIERTEFDYSYFEINMELPAGTDLKALVPEFTLYDAANEKVFIGDAPQVSGSTAVDFSSPVTYRFEASHKDNPAVKVESTCVVNVTLK